MHYARKNQTRPLGLHTINNNASWKNPKRSASNTDAKPNPKRIAPKRYDKPLAIDTKETDNVWRERDRMMTEDRRTSEREAADRGLDVAGWKWRLYGPMLVSGNRGYWSKV